jgi:NADH:ubiquinone oxidoreductase subunit 3 (subunit A)
MRAVLLGGGIAFGVILLAGIAVAIVLPITIRRKRLRKQQTTTPYASGFPAAHQPEYPGQRAADHVNEEQWRHPNE